MGWGVWRLEHDQELLGEIEILDQDFPWLSGRFTAQPAFTRFKPLFDRELQLLAPESDDPAKWHAWESAYDAIAEALTLIDNAGNPVAEFLLHIEDDQAWFRWSDEPFDQS